MWFPEKDRTSEIKAILFFLTTKKNIDIKQSIELNLTGLTRLIGCMNKC